MQRSFNPDFIRNLLKIILPNQEPLNITKVSEFPDDVSVENKLCVFDNT